MKVFFTLALIVTGSFSVLKASNDIYSSIIDLRENEYDVNKYRSLANTLESKNLQEIFRDCDPEKMVSIAEFLRDARQYEKSAEGFIKAFKKGAMNRQVATYLYNLTAGLFFTSDFEFNDSQESEIKGLLLNEWRKQDTRLDFQQNRLKNKPKEILEFPYLYLESIETGSTRHMCSQQTRATDGESRIVTRSELYEGGHDVESH